MGDCAKEVILYSLIKISVEEGNWLKESKIIEDEMKMKIN